MNDHRSFTFYVRPPSDVICILEMVTDIYVLIMTQVVGHLSSLTFIIVHSASTVGQIITPVKHGMISTNRFDPRPILPEEKAAAFSSVHCC